MKSNSDSVTSKIKSSPTIEDDLPGQVAQVLGVSAEAIRNFSEEMLIFYIQEYAR